jgi:uncharacterized protein YutE (UPF0331/DUF86 family)
MTYLVERLADLRRHLDHLRAIRPRVTDAAQLETDLSLHNDVLFSLLVVCQSVIDIAGELAGRRAIRFQDYTGAIRALRQVEGIPPDLIEDLLLLPGFRNVVIHEYVDLDYTRVIEALDHLDPLERFLRAAAALETVS